VGVGGMMFADYHVQPLHERNQLLAVPVLPPKKCLDHAVDGMDGASIISVAHGMSIISMARGIVLGQDPLARNSGLLRGLAVFLAPWLLSGVWVAAGFLMLDMHHASWLRVWVVPGTVLHACAASVERCQWAVFEYFPRAGVTIPKYYKKKAFTIYISTIHSFFGFCKELY